MVLFWGSHMMPLHNLLIIAHKSRTFSEAVNVFVVKDNKSCLKNTLQKATER
ncbi:hypothetical protein HanXRQr2_Chr13g0580761 [Helianthus annuus]|uniref:Uncharacterized protein n=1 Tax=Helianthus annuus TaxID=4232 RepID=A0A9K3EGH6_HELAN|nr:hypothetical protein HanXRQr2_Chr13g0580761 [Helianthus annuus]KAJ0848560.1 hypothetical protein HanPSC8_Chr13g0558911 [Helianthus annuus]